MAFPTIPALDLVTTRHAVIKAGAVIIGQAFNFSLPVSVDHPRREVRAIGQQEAKVLAGIPVYNRTLTFDMYVTENADQMKQALGYAAAANNVKPDVEKKINFTVEIYDAATAGGTVKHQYDITGAVINNWEPSWDAEADSYVANLAYDCDDIVLDKTP